MSLGPVPSSSWEPLQVLPALTRSDWALSCGQSPLCPPDAAGQLRPSPPAQESSQPASSVCFFLQQESTSKESIPKRKRSSHGPVHALHRGGEGGSGEGSSGMTIAQPCDPSHCANRQESCIDRPGKVSLHPGHRLAAAVMPAGPPTHRAIRASGRPPRTAALWCLKPLPVGPSPASSPLSSEGWGFACAPSGYAPFLLSSPGKHPQLARPRALVGGPGPRL